MTEIKKGNLGTGVTAVPQNVHNHDYTAFLQELTITSGKCAGVSKGVNGGKTSLLSPGCIQRVAAPLFPCLPPMHCHTIINGNDKIANAQI